MQGTKIGNYTVTSLIGEGGMGTVYRMVHDSLGRPAAVKFLLPAISNSRDIVTRFFNEARSAASIRHPGIVDVLDFGFLPDGRAYIIMEHLEGESLGARLRRVRRLPQGDALQIVRLTARALQAAHERGIVHRDIKPDNIFLVPEPDLPTGERVKLLDFGIAKLGGNGGFEESLTQAGAVMGTPTYMAPEQCRGASAVDHRVDIYALGCILYELLCGRPPFVAESAADIISHHLYFQPEAPRLHNPEIPAALEALMLSLLQKDPGMRPPTATALVDSIDQLAGKKRKQEPSISPLDETTTGISRSIPAPLPTLRSKPTTGPRLRPLTGPRPRPTTLRPPPTTLGAAASAVQHRTSPPAAAPSRPPRRWLMVAVAGVSVAAAVAAVAFAATRGGGAKKDAKGAAVAAQAPAPDAAEPATPPMPPPTGPSTPPMPPMPPMPLPGGSPPGGSPPAPRLPSERPGAVKPGSQPPASSSSAVALNVQGKELMFNGMYTEASAKFRAAVAASPEPAYLLNLCLSLYQEGVFGEALTACKAVAGKKPKPEQKAKAEKLIGTIRDEAKRQGVTLPK